MFPFIIYFHSSSIQLMHLSHRSYPCTSLFYSLIVCIFNYVTAFSATTMQNENDLLQKQDRIYTKIHKQQLEIYFSRIHLTCCQRETFHNSDLKQNHHTFWKQISCLTVHYSKISNCSLNAICSAVNTNYFYLRIKG